MNFVSEEQRHVVAKYLTGGIPRKIGECNELITFLQVIAATIAAAAINHFESSSGGGGGDNSSISSENEVPDAETLKNLTKEQHRGSVDHLPDLMDNSNLRIHPGPR